MDEAVIAWAAGVFEGEGCISLSPRACRLSLEMTDRDVVERFGRVVGVGHVSPRGLRPDRPDSRPTFVWRVSAVADVRLVLAALYPWLGERRQSRVEEALSHIAEVVPPGERTHCVHGHPFSGANLLVAIEGGRARRVCRACRNRRASATRRRQRAEAREVA